MSDASSIEWTDATWNPVTGCTKVSPGCDHCYALTLAERFRGTSGHYFEHGFDVQLRPAKLDQPLRWKKPRKVFVNSMSDLFHTDVPDEYIAQVFAVMAMAPQHTFQILTKRHARMRSLLSSAEFREAVRCSISDRRTDGSWAPTPLVRWPLPNIWLGVSVENQQWADIRIPALLDTPAAVRFLSCEPLLGPLVLPVCQTCNGSGDYPEEVLPEGVASGGDCPDCCGSGNPGIDWVIVGGESGHGARPMHPDWARGLRDECTTYGVPFLFKQWGDDSLWIDKQGDVWTPGVDGLMHTPETAPFSREHVERKWGPLKALGKHTAGRELDGRTYDEYPPMTPR